MPFLGGKQVFLLKTKKGKDNKKKTNREGLGPSEVALRATSPDPLKTKKKQKNKKKKTKKQKQDKKGE